MSARGVLASLWGHKLQIEKLNREVLVNPSRAIVRLAH